MALDCRLTSEVQGVILCQRQQIPLFFPVKFSPDLLDAEEYINQPGCSKGNRKLCLAMGDDKTLGDMAHCDMQADVSFFSQKK